jgi:hypothetical protein
LVSQFGDQKLTIEIFQSPNLMTEKLGYQKGYQNNLIVKKMADVSPKNYLKKLDVFELTLT